MKTYKEVYKFPFHNQYSWIYDDSDNFVFQFEIRNDRVEKLILDTINGNILMTNKELSFRHENGYIISNQNDAVILIRGWGNLTSPNCLGFSPEEATNIQDTLAEYIIERLNKRE